MTLIILWAVKLFAAVIAFTAIGYAGVRDKRLAGILLTFPILNGIALLTDPAPFVVANTIYAVVIFNSVLFACLITFGHRFVRRTGPKGAGILYLVIAWAALWLVGAAFLTIRPSLVSGQILFVIAIALCVGFTWRAWSRSPAVIDKSAMRINQHLHAYFDFWQGADKRARIAIFIGAFAILLVASATLPSAWVGTFSALPLPGLFALASLTTDTDDPRTLLPIRDTVFWGPVLVIPFNFLFAAAVTWLTKPGIPILTGVLLLLGFWSVAFVIIYYLIYWLTPRLDRR